MLGGYLKAILDHSPESIVLIAKNHQVLTFNKTIKEILFDYFHRELTEGDLYYPDYVVEANRELYLNAFNRAAAGEATYVETITENEVISNWFRYKVNPMIDGDGAFIGISLSARNITAEKQAELKILDLSEKLKAILDNTDESITLLDKDYKVLAMNEVALKNSGYNTNYEAAIGDDFRKFLPDKNNLFYEYFPKAIAGESSLVEIDYKNAKGEVLWYLTKFNPVYNQDGCLMGVSVFAQDITDKKILEISLRESEELFRKITILAPVGIIITDGKFGITYANVAAKKMLQYQEIDEVTHLNITDIVLNFTLSSKHKLRVDDLGIDIETPIFNQERFEAVTKNNERVSVLLSSSSFYTKNKESYIFIIQDITDVSSQEELIFEQNSKLRDIAWYQSHIIRAPLTKIMGLVSLLEDKSFEESINDKDRSFFYNAILESSHELDKVVHDIVAKTA